jgi:hypothetical protein
MMNDSQCLVESMLKRLLKGKLTHQDYPDELYKQWALFRAKIVSIRDILTQNSEGLYFHDAYFIRINVIVLSIKLTKKYPRTSFLIKPPFSLEKVGVVL